MATLFELMSTEGWTNVMFAGVDARGIEMQPIRDFAPLWQIYFMAYMILGSQLIINLFVGEAHPKCLFCCRWFISIVVCFIVLTKTETLPHFMV